MRNDRDFAGGLRREFDQEIAGVSRVDDDELHERVDASEQLSLPVAVLVRENVVRGVDDRPAGEPEQSDHPKREVLRQPLDVDEVEIPATREREQARPIFEVLQKGSQLFYEPHEPVGGRALRAEVEKNGRRLETLLGGGEFVIAGRC